MTECEVDIEFPEFDRDIIKDALSKEIESVRTCTDAEAIKVGEYLYKEFVTGNNPKVGMNYSRSLLLVMIMSNYSTKIQMLSEDRVKDRAKIQEIKRVLWFSKKLTTSFVVKENTGNFIGGMPPEWGMD
jgi:hypothetical protein